MICWVNLPHGLVRYVVELHNEKVSHSGTGDLRDLISKVPSRSRRALIAYIEQSIESDALKPEDIAKDAKEIVDTFFTGLTYADHESKVKWLHSRRDILLEGAAVWGK